MDTEFVLVSFAGIGAQPGINSQGGYRRTVYRTEGAASQESQPTSFVQGAICELTPFQPICTAYVLVTPTARERSFVDLKEELLSKGVLNVNEIPVRESLSEKSIWEWFGELFERIPANSQLILDITHGFRAIPAVMTGAIDLLRRTKGVRVAGVYYGVLEDEGKTSRLVDLSSFYTVGNWAEAVTNMTSYLDPAGFSRLNKTVPRYQQVVLQRKDFVSKTQELSSALRSLSLNRIPLLAYELQQMINKHRDDAGFIEASMLNHLSDWVTKLSPGVEWDGRLDLRYFEIQLAHAELLANRSLLMQAFTVLREMIGTLGALKLTKISLLNNPGRAQRTYASEYFISALSHARDDWNFTKPRGSAQTEALQRVIELYDFIEERDYELLQRLRETTGVVAEYRNGFDHAWMKHKQEKEDALERAQECCTRLEDIVQRFHGYQIIPS